MHPLFRPMAFASALLLTLPVLSMQRNPNRGHGHHHQRMAPKKYVLKFFGEQFKQQSTIKLKQELKQQYPAIQLQGSQVEQVKLVAKSKQGQGKATLQIGSFDSFQEIIGGYPQEFHDEAGYTYDKINFNLPRRTSKKGVWQIHLQGNIKVKRVVIFLKSKPMTYTKKIDLDIWEHYRGSNIIPLKSMLKHQTNLIPNDYKLVQVKVIGKSKNGGGKVSLIVGQEDTLPMVLDGSPHEFQGFASYTMDQIRLHAPGFASGGKWQLGLQGNIKIKTVTLTLQDKF